MKKIVSIMTKTLKELLRNRRTLTLTLGFPVVFMVIFGLVFGASSSTTYEVTVVNEDAGVLGAQYVAGLSQLKYEDGTALVRVTNATTLADSKQALTERDTDLAIRIPNNFTADLTPPPTNPNTNPLPIGGQPRQGAPPKGARVQVVFDAASPDSQAASSIVDSYTQAFAAQAARQAPLVVSEREVVTSSELTAFDFIAPGLMVYAVLNLAPQAAALLARESESRTLDRLKLTRMGTMSLLVGVSLAQLVVAVIALALMIGVALLFDFHPQGSLWVGVVVALVAAMATIGVGMIIGSFAKRQEDAANLGVLFAVPASFLSGAFFAIPAVPLFEIAGRSIGLYDILPSTWAIKALRSILTLGQTLASQTFEIGALLVLTVLYFGVGAWLFTARRMRSST